MNLFDVNKYIVIHKHEKHYHDQEDFIHDIIMENKRTHHLYYKDIVFQKHNLHIEKNGITTRNPSFSGSIFENCNFVNIEIKFNRFIDCKFINCKFINCNIINCDFYKAVAIDSYLIECKTIWMNYLTTTFKENKMEKQTLKQWMWSRPQYKEDYWNKVDNVVDSTLDGAFNNKVVKMLSDAVDKSVKYIDSIADKIFKTQRKVNE